VRCCQPPWPSNCRRARIGRKAMPRVRLRCTLIGMQVAEPSHACCEGADRRAHVGDWHRPCGFTADTAFRGHRGVGSRQPHAEAWRNSNQQRLGQRNGRAARMLHKEVHQQKRLPTWTLATAHATGVRGVPAALVLQHSFLRQQLLACCWGRACMPRYCSEWLLPSACIRCLAPSSPARTTGDTHTNCTSALLGCPRVQ
jgi:hypothetical protein